MNGKICSRCLEYKPCENFTKKTVNKDGLNSRCKECSSQVNKLRYENDPEKFKTSAKKWRDDNIERHRSNSLNWAKNNSDQSKQNKKRNISENLDRYEAYYKEYRNNHKEEKRQYNKIYYATNKEKFFGNNAKRRALKQEQPHPNHDPSIEIKLFSIASKLYKETGVRYNVDHIWPLSKGGPHHHDNLQVISKDLNLEKNDSLLFKHPDIKTWCDLPTHILKWIKCNKSCNYTDALEQIINRGKHLEEEVKILLDI